VPRPHRAGPPAWISSLLAAAVGRGVEKHQWLLMPCFSSHAFSPSSKISLSRQNWMKSLQGIWDSSVSSCRQLVSERVIVRVCAICGPPWKVLIEHTSHSGVLLQLLGKNFSHRHTDYAAWTVGTPWGYEMLQNRAKVACFTVYQFVSFNRKLVCWT